MKEAIPERVGIQMPGLLKVVSPGAAPGLYAVTVIDYSEGGLRVRLSEPIDVSMEVELRFDSGTTLTGTVLYCRSISSLEYSAGIYLGGVQDPRRTEARQPAKGDVKLVVREKTERHTVYARRFDASRHGLGVVASESIEPGCEILVILDGLQGRGIVRNSRRLDSGEYRIGIQLRDLRSEGLKEAVSDYLQRSTPEDC